MEVREFDWDSSRKGASQLPRTKTIRLSAQKTTTGENLILGYTSPLTGLVAQASVPNRHSLRTRSHMHWGFASATRFCGSEPGVAPAEPRVYGHTYKQGTTPTSAENERKVDCGAYGTENRRGQ